MDSRDRRLGMDRKISRRDFLNGVSVADAMTESAIAEAHRAVYDLQHQEDKQ